MVDDRVFFVGVGAAKAGTTWLADRIGSHSQIFMSPLKEMHWFDPELRRRSFDANFARMARRTIELIEKGRSISPQQAAVLRRLSLTSDHDYLAFFLAGCERNHRAFGEFTPSYSLLKASDFRRIVDIYPNTKLLFVMRNPVDRLWSNYKFRHARMDEPIPDRLDRSLLTTDLLNFGGRGAYPRMLEAMWAAAAADQVFVCFYEHLFSRQHGRTTLTRLWRFLGVDDEATSDEALHERLRETPGTGIPTEDRRLILERLASVYRWVAAHFDELPESWQIDLHSLDRSGAA